MKPPADQQNLHCPFCKILQDMVLKAISSQRHLKDLSFCEKASTQTSDVLFIQFSEDWSFKQDLLRVYPADTNPGM